MEGTWGLRPGSMLTDPLAPDGFGGPELDLDLRQRSNLLELDRQFYAHWNLGQNLVLAWSPTGDGVQLLVVPHYAVASYGAGALPAGGDPRAESPAHQCIMHLLSGARQFQSRQNDWQVGYQMHH